MSAHATAKLDQIYIGEREAGHPVMRVLVEDGAESPFAPASGWFDWGWPSLSATKRLARALLAEVTGREPPAAVSDAFATEELAHFPWAAFSLTGRELLGWVEARGETVADWPEATPTTRVRSEAPAPPPARDRVSRRRSAAARVSRSWVPARAPLVALRASA
jgi:hypothetical protein